MNSRDVYFRKNSDKNNTAKLLEKMSIFTIDEENENIDS